MKTTFGRHLLAEYRGSAIARLSELELVEALMERAAGAEQANLEQAAFHRFSPQGVSGAVVVKESHPSPGNRSERRDTTVDFRECGDCHPEAAHALPVEGLMAFHRGLLDEPRDASLGSLISRNRHVVSEPTSIVHGA